MDEKDKEHEEVMNLWACIVKTNIVNIYNQIEGLYAEINALSKLKMAYEKQIADYENSRKMIEGE